MNLNQVTLPALDVAASVAFYRGMGFMQTVDSAHYARFECPQGDATFSVHTMESMPQDPGVVVWKPPVTGFSSHRPTTAGSGREARLLDPSGNVLCLYQPGENRRNPPWRMPAP